MKEKANHVSVPSLYNILRSIIVRFGRSLLLAVLAICMLSVRYVSCPVPVLAPIWILVG